MILTISRLIANLFGFDISKVQKWVLLALMILIGIIVLAFGLWVRSCVRKPAKIDEKSIQKINTANERERKGELDKVLRDNTDVIRTNDNRTTLTEATIEQREQTIDAKLKVLDTAIVEAKQQGRDITADELTCLLIPEECK